jgi:hypothetical protein
MEKGLGGIGAAWPNSYTFSKAISEHLLQQNKEHVPVTIVRPSIITCAIKEPVPGWIDSLMALGAAMMAAGMGMLRQIPGPQDNLVSCVPIDLFVNTILCVLPYLAQQKKEMIQQNATVSPHVLVCHSCCSSMAPPYRWRQIIFVVNKYYQEHPLHRRIGKTGVVMIKNRPLHDLLFFFRYTLLSQIVSLYSEKFGTEQHKKMAFDLARLERGLKSIYKAFNFFISCQYIFDQHKARLLSTHIVPDERPLFDNSMDVIAWDYYTELFCYGIGTFCLNEPNLPVPPSPEHYVPRPGHSGTYTASLRQRVLWDLHDFGSEKTTAVIQSAKNIQSWWENRNNPRVPVLSKL